jgi:hypothetical protein
MLRIRQDSITARMEPLCGNRHPNTHFKGCRHAANASVADRSRREYGLLLSGRRWLVAMRSEPPATGAIDAV